MSRTACDVESWWQIPSARRGRDPSTLALPSASITLILTSNTNTKSNLPFVVPRRGLHDLGFWVSLPHAVIEEAYRCVSQR